MTEEEWLATTDPERMLDHIRLRITDRKRRLFALACLPAVVGRLTDPESVAGVQVFADFTDERVAADELHHTWGRAVAALNALLDDPSEQRWHHVAVFAADAVALALNPNPGDNIAVFSARCVHTLATAAGAGAEADVRLGECRRQVRLIHDIFGNPFRPSAFDPAWRTHDVIGMARGIYEERAFDRMPILADALQDAGCDDEAILSHCRDANQLHVRGCWAVDLVLGKR